MTNHPNIHRCERLLSDSNGVLTDNECGKPATLYREFRYKSRRGHSLPYYYCSEACAEADREALWGIGYDPVGELRKI